MTAQHLPHDPAAFDLLGWLDTGTVARQHVTIYADQAAAKRLEEIEKRLTALGADADTDEDAPLGGDPRDTERETLEAEAAELLERLDASKAVWEVRAISATEVDDATAAVPMPKPPIQPPANAPERQQERFRDRVVKFAQEQTDAALERRLHMIARAVVQVTTSRGTVDGVSVEHLRQLRARPYGQGWLDRLWTAIEAATEEEVEVPRPTSPGRSTSDLG